MGMLAVRLRSLIICASSKPVMPGMRTSRISTAKSCAISASSASSPEFARTRW